MKEIAGEGSKYCTVHDENVLGRSSTVSSGRAPIALAAAARVSARFFLFFHELLWSDEEVSGRVEGARVIANALERNRTLNAQDRNDQ